MPRHQFASEHLAENLELARTVHERLTARRRYRQPNAISISIADTSSVQCEDRLDSGSKIQKISETYLGFLRVRAPLGNRLTNRFVEIQNSILDGSRRGNTPEALGSAVDRRDPICRIPVGITFVHSPAILDDQEGIAAPRR